MERDLIVMVLEDQCVVEIRRHNGPIMSSLPSVTSNAVREMARLLDLYPDVYIAWYEKSLEPFLSDITQWPALLNHPLEILHLSCFQRCDRMVESLGLIDFGSPFLLPGPTDRRFVTWLISPMAGIGLAALFKAAGFTPSVPSFAVALFDMGYRGQQWGLCAYSEPKLLSLDIPASVLHPLQIPLSTVETADLIRRIYKKKWLFYWFCGCILLRIALPIRGVIWGTFTRVSSTPVDQDLMSSLHPALPEVDLKPSFVDVVIPTLGRPLMVIDLLTDLAKQTLLPHKVIIVEQIPEVEQSDLAFYLQQQEWPFPIQHQVISHIGACHARNLALTEIESQWILLLDDDIRLTPNFLRHLVQVTQAYHVDGVNGAVYLPNQNLEKLWHFSLPHVWHTLGSGSVLLARQTVEQVGGFDERIEGGFGEDAEFGTRLRLLGANILFTSSEPVLHLKALRGGFRHEFNHPWRQERIQPRPSPTVLYAMRKHATDSMRDGYMVFYWLKRLGSVPIYRLPIEIYRLWREWRCSVKWATWLAQAEIAIS